MNPKGLKKDEYDAIIIGAGIGGLVCGCYLVKAGMKVLIVEQHNKVGGYCTSFRRGRFTFEVGALEECHEDGHFGRIIRELGIDKKIEIIRTNPSHIIIMPRHKITFKNNINETIENLKFQFPFEAKKIDEFFNFLKSSNFILLYLRWKNKTFEDILNMYFDDAHLKAFFSFLVGQVGVPPLRLSALTAAVHLKKNFLEGVYYPKGGMQALANSFAERFQELNGKLILSNLAKKIKINNGKVEGVILQDGNFIQSKYVVSNCDVTQTFIKLVGEEHLNKKFVKKVRNLLPSISVFIVYLGIGKKLREDLDFCHELWYSPSFDIDDPWNRARLERKSLKSYIFCYFPSFCDSALAPNSSESIALCVLTPYRNDEFWIKNKQSLADKLIQRIEDVIPNLSNYIVEKEIATPKTLYKYTLNRNGAMRGWMATASQIDKSIMPQETPIRRLFLAGHWVTVPSGESGLPMAGYTGFISSKLILKDKRTK